LREAQNRKKHPDAKPLKGFYGARVLEIVTTLDHQDMETSVRPKWLDEA
jgi:hypothetical protein